MIEETRRSVPWDRSYLYAPASNAKILAGVLDKGADAVVLDLEDGVAPMAKPAARTALRAFLDQIPEGQEGPRILVRINRDGPGWSEEDLRVAVHPRVAALSLPKAESGGEVAGLADLLRALELEQGMPEGATGLHLIIESALGVARLEDLAHVGRVERFGLGAADLQADLGIIGDPHACALDHLRGKMVLTSRLSGLAPPVDSVHVNFRDLDGLATATQRARGFGFFGKSAIHPSQVTVINEIFTPSPEETTWASRAIDAAAEAEKAGVGVVEIDGAMIDAPIIDRAKAILRLASKVPNKANQGNRA